VQRQDYVLRLIEQLGGFFRQLRRYRELGHTDEALISLVRAQETLFGKPAQEFAALTVDQQFELLTAGELPERGCQKACAYAALLRSASEVYSDRAQDALADGASLLSSSILTLAAEKYPDRVRETMDRFAALQSAE
jgi:hypothetical protein